MDILVAAYVKGQPTPAAPSYRTSSGAFELD